MPLLLLIFAASGCAALIYEIVWFQLLELVIGSTTISIAVLLGTYMGGLCLGSLLAPRLVAPSRHPLRAYATIELLTGAFGLVVLALVPFIGGAYAALAPHGPASVALRALLCAVALLPPTLLMGATLPVVARWVQSSRTGVARIGLLYGSNIAGGVFGCVVAGFYLLRVFDTHIATYVAVALNVVAASAALLLARGSSVNASALDGGRIDASGVPVAAAVYVVIALSGFTALGAEVVWTRLLSIMFGATVYTFSIILAVFLVGLGIGSTAGSLLSRRVARPREALGWSQLLLTAGIAWAAYIIAVQLPDWPLMANTTTSLWSFVSHDLARSAAALLPATILWGASFPLAIAGVARDGTDNAGPVSRIYAANTVGAIAGAVIVSVISIPALGTQSSEKMLVLASAAAAIVAFGSGMLAGGRRRTTPAVALTFAVAAALAFTVRLPRVPDGVVAFGRAFRREARQPTYRYVGEGMNSSVAVSERYDGVRSFHVAGKVEASTDPPDMRLQRMLGHLSALLHREPRTVLVVGFGAGVTAGTFVLHPSVKRIVICEIEPLIPRVVSRYFSEANYDVLDDPRVEVVYDDVRHYILTSHEKFDVITSDPIHPWVKGAAALYTSEYFDAVKRHLNPGGVVTQWVPLYESRLDVVKSELATFFDAFPNGTVWSNEVAGEGYDVVLVGQRERMHVGIDALQHRLERPDHARVAESLRDVGFPTAVSLIGTYAGEASDLSAWLRDASINHDRDLRLQYLAGLGLNSAEVSRIYPALISYRRWPDGLIAASPMNELALKQRWNLATP